MRGAVAAGWLALATGVAGAGGLAVGLQDDPQSPGVAAVASPAPVPSPGPVRTPLLPAVQQAAAPSPAGLAAALASALADPALGASPAGAIVDAQTGEVLLDRRGAAPLLPASTAKIATAVAALTALEPGTRLHTRVLAGAAPGEIVLVGGGDVTLAGPAAEPGYPVAARVDELAAQVRALLVPGPLRVLVDDSAYTGPLLGPGWQPGYVGNGDVAPVSALSVDAGRLRAGRSPRVPDPALAAGRALAVALGEPSAPVLRGAAPAGAAPLGSVQSPPVEQLVEAMLSRSDNDIAESLARQVALARGLPASFEGGSAALAGVLAEVVPDAGAGFVLADGSGLSRLSRLQPMALVRLLAAVARDEGGRLAPVLSGLPVAGFDGTLADRYRTGPSVPAAGVVRAKTGTLSGVSALAGLVRTRDGRVLAFDLIADGVPPGANRAAEAALDRLAAGLASCGCR